MEENVPFVPNDDSSNLRRFSIKILYPVLLAIVAAITMTGIFVDSYFIIDTSKLSIKSPNGKTKLPHENLKVRVTPKELEILEPEDLRDMKIPYTVESDSIYSDFFQRFDNYLVGLDFTKLAWRGVEISGYVAVCLTLIALIMQLIFREEPTTLVFKVGSTFSDSWKGAVPLWLSMMAALIELIRIIPVTSFIQSVAARMAFYSIFIEMTHIERAEFETALDAPTPRTYLLETMRSVGEWIDKGDGFKWSIASFSVLIAAGLNLILILVVFYMDTRIVRVRLSLDSERNPQLVAAMRRELNQLPRHCRIRSIWYSTISFSLSVIASKLTGRFTWNTGRQLNRLRWTKETDQYGGINDLISSYTRHIWLHPAHVVDGAVLMWVPLTLIIIVGSINRLDAFSKLLEMVSQGYWLRAISIALTVFPTPTTPVQLPICYGEWMMNFWTMLSTSEFCNDMIYSGHATLVLTPCLILIFLLIYGPFRGKLIAIVLILILVYGALGVIVVGRFHYTADVLVAGSVCFFLALIHAPAWKIMFSYRRFQLNLGSTKGIDKCAGQMEVISSTLDVLIRSRKIDYDRTNWTMIDQKQEEIRRYLEILKTEHVD
jgi:hypothetical protein